LDTANLRIVFGEKYGLIGKNGIGKTTLMNYICSKAIEGVPKDLHVTLVEQEIEGDELNPLQHVLNCDVERTKLLASLNELQGENAKDKDPNLIIEVTKRLSDIQSNQAEAKAFKILSGLGFPNEYMKKATKELSGGWKMRVALAQALYSSPDLLLLDEPTNHLDIETVMWLEDYLLKMDSTVIVVSHAREFLNNVARVIIHFENAKLEYYKGNYYDYERIRCDLIKIRKRAKETQDRQLGHIQEFIDKYNYYQIPLQCQKSKLGAVKNQEGTED
jgi:ATP-binding cassette subfamily F protein 3